MEMKTKMNLSKIIYGAWRIANTGEETSPKAVLKKIETCLEHGITTIDHADIYGNYQAEAVFGAALKLAPQLRKEMQLITKCGIKLVSANRPEHSIKSYDTSAAHITESVERSLKNLNTDHIDLLLIHRPDPLMNPEEIGGIVGQLLDQGKLGAFGVSNFLPHHLELFRLRCPVPVVANQIEVSLIHTQPMYDGTLDYCHGHGIMPLAWSPFAGGRMFTELDIDSPLRTTLRDVGRKYDLNEEQMALAWLHSHPANIRSIIGSQKTERIVSASKVRDTILEREDWFALLKAASGQDVA
jgi:predicted oxidoreductase